MMLTLQSLFSFYLGWYWFYTEVEIWRLCLSQHIQTSSSLLFCFLIFKEYILCARDCNRWLIYRFSFHPVSYCTYSPFQVCGNWGMEMLKALTEVTQAVRLVTGFKPKLTYSRVLRSYIPSHKLAMYK